MWRKYFVSHALATLIAVFGSLMISQHTNLDPIVSIGILSVFALGTAEWIAPLPQTALWARLMIKRQLISEGYPNASAISAVRWKGVGFWYWKVAATLDRTKNGSETVLYRVYLDGRSYLIIF